ncbi:MAG: tetratricopeptide repeat protein [Deltaproteobacteria bacterium]|nr:tetratricopeptide repeat protein [Deltaproteobacteria bacterium]
MGKKQDGSRKHVYFYLAGLILLTFSGCATCAGLQNSWSAYGHVSRAETFLEQGDFEKAAQESQRSLDLAGKKSPGDKALFTLGLIYAHYGKAKKDYEKSLAYFRKVVSDYPTSPLIGESRIWIDTLQAIEKTKKRKFGKPFRYEEEIGEFLDHAEELLDLEDYEGTIAESQKILELNGEDSPKDEALFVLGLVYAHYGNAKRDYEKSLGYFKELVSKYPKSPMVARTRIWIGVLEIIEKMKQVDIELEKKKKEWTE